MLKPRRFLPLFLAVAVSFCTSTAATTANAPDDTWYVLPFPVGVASELIQGNNGPWGHTGPSAYSFDFIMPTGSAVTAARGGEVVKVEKRFRDGTKVPGEENYIFIRHADGTFGRYYHLTIGGALVDSGARVKRGDLIGRSGSSGASAGPHLHFDVTRDCPTWGCQTVPIVFRNAGTDSLSAGTTYTAASYPSR